MLKVYKKNKNLLERGFTLIELLVVISIIGLLSAIVLASVNTARAKARDAVRLSDIRQINNAIQLYISTNGHAPYIVNANGNNPANPAIECDISNPGTSCNTRDYCLNILYSDCTSGILNSWLSLQTLLSPYLSKLPRDPSPDTVNNTRYYFYYGPSSLKWKYDYCTENDCDISWMSKPSSNSDYIIGVHSLEKRTDNSGFLGGGGTVPSISSI